MKRAVELRYISLFTFSLVVTVVALVISIHKLQPLLFQQIFTSCTAAYEQISANSLVISTVFALGLTLLFASLSLKLLLSSYRTSKSLISLSIDAQKHFPRSLSKVIKKLGLSKKLFLVTSHSRPLAVTAGILSPKVVLSKSLIKQLNERELEAVVLHEIYHQQHRHGLLYILAEAIAASLTAIIPVLKDVIKNMKLDFETSADQHAVSFQGSSKYISSALAKLSPTAISTPLPSFATVLDIRLRRLGHVESENKTVSKRKLLFSLFMIMTLSFFASMPVDTSKNIVYAEHSETTNVCVSKFSVGMSKWQNSSSNLPASVF
ncbi:MAG: hypothetical protein QG639_55 [Patescibacteria group bacterium]|nr:hypothetical protein [Patescibacteria group bacterium]